MPVVAVGVPFFPLEIEIGDPETQFRKSYFIGGNQVKLKILHIKPLYHFGLCCIHLNYIVQVEMTKMKEYLGRWKMKLG